MSRSARSAWLVLVLGLYAASFFPPAVLLHGHVSGVSTTWTLDGGACFAWGLHFTRPAWFANLAFGVGCGLLALRRPGLAALAAVAALGLALSEPVSDVLVNRHNGEQSDYLLGYWMWAVSMLLLAAVGLAARRGPAGGG